MAQNILAGDWSGVFDGFFPDPNKTAQIQHTAEQIKALQLKRAADEDQLRTVRELIKRQGAQYGAMAPPATDIPMAPNFSLPSFDSTGAPIGQGAVTPADPLRLDNMPRSWGVDEPFYRARDTAQSQAALAAQLARNPGDVAKLTGLDALGQLNMSGIPQGAPAQNLMQAQLSTVDAKLPGVGTAAPAVHNYAYTDPATGQQVTGRTTNGLTDIVTGKQIPANASMAGAADLTPKSPFGTPEAARAELATGAVGRKAMAGQHLTTQETEQLGILLDTAYPEKLVTRTEDNRQVTYRQRDALIPQDHQRLVDLVNEYRSGVHLRPQQPPQPPPDPFAAGARNIPVPGVPATAVPTVGADPNAPPIVQFPPVSVTSTPAASMGNQPVEVSRGPVAAQALSDNFRAEPVYKTYDTVLQTWNTLARYGEGGYDGTFNNGNDLAIIYHIAKMFDPGSAVKEGELTMARNIGPIADSLIALFRAKFLDGGILPAKVRADLIYAGQQKLEETGSIYERVVSAYRDRAERGGVNPSDVIIELPEPRTIDYPAMVQRGKQAEAQQAPTPPQVDPRQIDPNALPPWQRGGP